MAVNGQDEQGDLQASLALSPSEASQGTTRLLYLPDGRTLNVIIPPGTQSGQVIRIDGQGLLATNGGSRGALLITAMVAQSEQFGPSPYSFIGSDSPTEFHTPSSAPPPPLVQQAYPSYNQASTAQNTPVSDAHYLHVGPVTPTPSASLYGAGSSPSYYSTGSYSPRQPSRSNRAVIISAIIIGLVVLIAGSGLTYYAAVYLPAQQRTRQVAAAATATSIQQTLTAQNNATQSTQATATAYPQALYNQVVSRQPSFNDALSNNSANAWDVNSHCSFTNGSYHAIEEQTGYFFYCMNSAQRYQNFAFQVKMAFLRGSLGGIIFRADVQNSKYYLLRIDNSGRYDLFLYTDSNVNDVKKLGGDVTDAISPGSSTPYTVMLIAQGNVFSLYINKQFIVTITDPGSTFTSGQLGVTAEDYTQASEISYQQAQVWNL